MEINRIDDTKSPGICYEECGPFPNASKAERERYLKAFKDVTAMNLFTTNDIKNTEFDECIKYIGMVNGEKWYMIKAGDMVITTREAGAIEFDKALRAKVAEYVVKT